MSGPRPDTYWDAVVIGAGHNALVTAAYLAKAGHRTLVLERRERVGGAADTAQLAKGIRVPALAHTGRDQVGTRPAYGASADTEPYHPGPLGGNGFAGTELGLDQFLENAANLGAFGGGGRQCAITLYGRPLGGRVRLLTSEGREIDPAMVVLQCVSSPGLSRSRVSQCAQRSAQWYIAIAAAAPALSDRVEPY